MQDSSKEWPKVFDSLRSQLAACAEPLVAISETWERQIGNGVCARKLTCGLVTEEQYELVVPEMELGYKVNTSGPYPCPRGEGEYIPRFWIHGAAAIPENIEPLALSWTADNKTVHLPDPGLLMTYGLAPRVVGTGGRIHWDEPTIPTHDVVVVNSISADKHFDETVGGVSILRNYLQDYASLRRKAVVCVFYERWIIKDDIDSQDRLGTERYREWRFQDARVRCQRVEGKVNEYHVDIWGHRLLLRPGPLPISEDATHFGNLIWPGIQDPVTDNNWRGQMFTFVHVDDAVLQRFEDRREYSIIPEDGSVSFGDQWSVDHCDRVGRNLIRVEVRKLYEAASPDIVRHYHYYSVAAPAGSVDELRRIRNIGIRCKDVVYGLANLGLAASPLVSRLLTRSVTVADLVSVEIDALNDCGWWKGKYVEPASRHVPKTLTLGGFVGRCKSLYQLLVEGLDERLLRQTLLAIGVQEKKIQDWRSLKCLNALVALAEAAVKSGLGLAIGSATALIQMVESADPKPCAPLFALNALRTLDAHRAGASKEDELGKGLAAFGVDLASVVPGFGIALDAVYDRLADELNKYAAVLAAVSKK